LIGTNAPQFEKRTHPLLIVGGVVALLAILWLQLIFSVRRESISWDETDHTWAGYMSWKAHDFGINPEHPPLVKGVAAIPILGMDLQNPVDRHRTFKVETVTDGVEWNARNIDKDILTRMRLAASVFALMLGLVIFCAAREIFGTAAGFIALTLVAFDPNILAHGAFVTTDTAVSALILATVYAFYRYLKYPSAARLVQVCICAGFALGAKHTGLLALFMIGILAVIELIWPMRDSDATARSRQAAADAGTQAPKPLTFGRMFPSLAIITAAAVLILWSFYGFRYSMRPAGVPMEPTFATEVSHVSHPALREVLTLVAKSRLLPESYLYGIADISGVNDFYTSFLMGTIYPHGTHTYFLWVLIIKSTIPFLILLVCGLAFAFRQKLGVTRREILFLTVPPVFYLMIAMASQMNIGVRHILPMYAFLYVLAAGAAIHIWRKGNAWAAIMCVLLAWQAIGSIRLYPDYMAYANEAWGNSNKTGLYLSDSNVDWGQQLIDVKKYLDAHNIKDCYFVYFANGAVDPHSYDIPCKFLPTVESLWWLNIPLNTPPVLHGTVLVSQADVAGFEFGPAPLNPWEQFKSLKPKDVIAHSVNVYEGDFAVPLASAYDHSLNATNLIDAKKYDEAVAEATAAVQLAPDAVYVNATMGDALVAAGRRAEAVPYYQKALQVAQTVQPEFQGDWAAQMQAKLAQK
jgi:tetratricopeptide (TPR) repeat protein